MWKKIRKYNLTLTGYLMSVVVTGLAIWSLCSNRSHSYIRSQNGVWDLSGVDFSSDIVQLSGCAEAVPNALLTPEEFENTKDKITINKPQNRLECMTTRIRLLVSGEGPYDIAGFTDNYGSRIYINGKHVTDVGCPAETKSENVPDQRFIYLKAEPKDNMIEIVQQSSNFVFRLNTSNVRWTIGNHENVNRWMSGLTYSYLINIGIYLALFLVHILLFLIIPSYRANLWFGLLCLVWIARTGLTSVQPFVVLFPKLGGIVAFRVNYMIVLAAMLLITLAYKRIFPGILPKWIRVSIYSLLSVLALYYLFADTLTMSYTMVFYEIAAEVCAGIYLYCFVKKLRKPDKKQWIIIASLFIVFISLMFDTLFYNEIRLPFMHNAFTETAILIFSLFQMAAMFVGTMEEVAAAKEAEQKLAADNASLERLNNMKTDLMAAISHETRTPLAVLSGYAGIVSMGLRDKGADEEIIADLDKIVFEAKRISGMLEEIQKISWKEGNEAKRILLDMNEVIRQTTQLYEAILERHGIKLELYIEDNLPFVFGCPHELTQVMFNLLSNAARHTECGYIKIELKTEAENLKVTVSDTGTGIDPELLPHVFEKHVHGKNGGSGLGLFFCREIIESHKGVITIESKTGKGTSVTFSLPK